MAKELDGKKIACLLARGATFEEVAAPREALEAAGATVEVLAPEGEDVAGMPVDKTLDHADPGEYDGLFVPGGRNLDALGTYAQGTAFVQDFIDKDKPIAVLYPGDDLEAFGQQAVSLFASADAY